MVVSPTSGSLAMVARVRKAFSSECEKAPPSRSVVRFAESAVIIATACTLADELMILRAPAPRAS
eukprot:5248384-Prymnesium_polylepis.1